METRWGKRFGRYEVVAELGRGAMGIVYKARDPKIDRFVAIKTICLVGHVLEEQQTYRERFFQEAQAAGRLVHPSIVTIFDVGEDPETNDPYIVMEYVAGVPLNGMLAEGTPLPLNTAMRLTQQIAEALDCAHAQGIVHRDIKPSNIMVTADGQAKIMDFGIAKLDSAHLTLPGNALGTPAYISPEQLNGHPVDGRADIFSLGVILYSMVTGYRPFQGNSALTVCFKVANREPLAPTVLDPNLPCALDAVIARAMAKNPVDRYQRGMELALDLRELLENRAPAINAKALAPNAASGRATAVSEAETCVGQIAPGEGVLVQKNHRALWVCHDHRSPGVLSSADGGSSGQRQVVRYSLFQFREPAAALTGLSPVTRERLLPRDSSWLSPRCRG